MIDGFNATPLISLPAFIIGFIAVLLIARAIVEALVYYSEQKKRPQELGRVPASASQKAIQRYYNREAS